MSVAHQARSLQDHGETLKTAQSPRETGWQVPKTSRVFTPSTITHVHSWCRGDPVQGQPELGAWPPPPRVLFGHWNTHKPPLHQPPAPRSSQPSHPGFPTTTRCLLAPLPAGSPKSRGDSKFVTTDLTLGMNRKGGWEQKPFTLCCPIFWLGCLGCGQRQTEDCVVKCGLSLSIVTNNPPKKYPKETL